MNWVYTHTIITDFCEVVVMKWCYIQWFNEWLLMSHERECNPNHILDVYTALHKAGGGIGRPTCAKVACNEC